METKATPAKRIAFMGGNDDFRAARMRCALACEEYNKLKEDAAVEDRARGWLRIVDPTDKTAKSTSAVDFSSLFRGGPSGSNSKITTVSDSKDTSSLEHESANTQIANIELPLHKPTLGRAEEDGSSAKRPTVPYIKAPVYMDYGLRVHIAPTTFINRNCTILDTPVADIVIGERCSIGPGVTIISVGHPVKFEDRCEFESGKAGSWGAKVVIGDGVWLGAGVTILPGVRIGSYTTIGGGSVVTKDIPSRCMATGNPATVKYLIDDKKALTAPAETAYTLEDALKFADGEDD